MTKRIEEKETVNVSNASLNIKDVAVILAVIVSLTLAWSAFSTRIAILERELVSLHSTISELKAQVKEIGTEQQRTKTDLIDLKHEVSGMPAPRRSTKEQTGR